VVVVVVVIVKRIPLFIRGNWQTQVSVSLKWRGPILSVLGANEANRREPLPLESNFRFSVSFERNCCGSIVLGLL